MAFWGFIRDIGRQEPERWAFPAPVFLDAGRETTALLEAMRRKGFAPEEHWSVFSFRKDRFWGFLFTGKEGKKFIFRQGPSS